MEGSEGSDRSGSPTSDRDAAGAPPSRVDEPGADDEHARTAREFETEARRLHERWVRLRAEQADLAEHLADHADTFASYFEQNATHGDTEHRLAVAAREREIAIIARRNAATLRDPDADHLRLEALPGLPGFKTPGEQSPPEPHPDPSGAAAASPAPPDLRLSNPGQAVADDLRAQRHRQPPDAHRHAAERHHDAAARHAQAAAWWVSRGDPEIAELERRGAAIEHDAEQLELDWVALKERRASPNE